MTMLAQLRQKMMQADVISFDFFDTLFVRPVVHAEDIFKMVGQRLDIPDFTQRRRAAQKRAFEVMSEQKRREITFAGIYACSPDLPATAHAMEWEMEQDLTLPNPEMTALFREAIAQGKQVVITSDMYFQAPFFTELLRRHDLPCVPLYISSDRNATKRDTGALFEILCRDLNTPPHTVLHIGDNLVADVERAREKGLQAFHYREARLPARDKDFSPATSLARALVRVHQEQVRAGSAHELGFMVGGPAAVGFLDWIIAQARADRVEHILFVSRDGYVLHQLLEQRRASGAAGLPASSYLLGSRVAFSLAAMSENSFPDFMEFLVSGAGGLSPDEIFARIGVAAPAAEILADIGFPAGSVIPDRVPETIRALVSAWQREILKVAYRTRRGLLRHLLQHDLHAGQKVAFVDIGWNGTTQEAFEAAIRELLPLDVRGYYFCLTDQRMCVKRARSMSMSALINARNTPPDLLHAIYDNRVAGEFFFSAPHDPVISYQDSTGAVMPVLDPGRGPTDNLLELNAEVLRGIVDFADRFEAQRNALALPADPSGMARVLVNFMADGRWASHPLLQTIRNFDSWASSRNRDMWMKDYACSTYAMP
ncbi:hydrolase [Komagataeibacter sp. FNDCF1]|uniref:HAD family hydrolase n=1 Tax=Komagataeibacter sp. FNDCF1 TaxID=2878681 RepID=UPI001E4A4A31|nr:hydrolase [Komagataeibacter sp. FNDCF1]MCE2565388.1 hydrolase [Komagataeibacter sp. FNDCF1]